MSQVKFVPSNKCTLVARLVHGQCHVDEVRVSQPATINELWSVHKAQLSKANNEDFAIYGTPDDVSTYQIGDRMIIDLHGCRIGSKLNEQFEFVVVGLYKLDNEELIWWPVVKQVYRDDPTRVARVIAVNPKFYHPVYD